MRLLIVLLLFTINIYSVQFAIESGYKNYENSRQKDNAIETRMSFSGEDKKISWLIGAENTKANTFKPPLDENLHIQKYFLNLGYNINDKTALKSSFLTISDNIAPTDGGNVYGLGVNYKYDKTTNLNTYGYFSDYKDFDVIQVDMEIIKKYNLSLINLNASLSSRAIFIKEETNNKYTQNAQHAYLSPDIKLSASKDKYFANLGISPFKKLFMVSENGTRVSHHAMELKNNIMFAFGKNFSKSSIAGKYNYGEADEIPINNKNVKINMLSIEFKNKF